MIKGILFDKDGTLLEFNSTMHHIYANFFTCLKEKYRVPELLLEKLRESLGHLPDRLKADSLLQFSTNPQIVEALIEPLNEYALEYRWQQPFNNNDVLELIEELSLREDVPYTTLPYVPETLRYLKGKGYGLGVATADTHRATVTCLKKTEIFEYFDFLGTGDGPKPKPDTFMADMFCRQCGITSNELLVVGDSEIDMLFAENVGANFIGIAIPGNNSSIFRGTAHRSVFNINEIIGIFNL